MAQGVLKSEEKENRWIFNENKTWTETKYIQR